MNTADDPQTRAQGAHINAPAENLLFTSYRCWMAGYATGDVNCWDLAWLALERTMPVPSAKVMYGEFHHFVRTIREHARRDVGWRPAACRCLCRDECVVLALIEASQRSHEPGETVYASWLLGRSDSAPLVEASRSLAAALSARGLVLVPLQHASPAATCGPATGSLH